MQDSNKKRQGKQHRETAARRQATLSAAAREIGSIPKPKHRRRRNACAKDFGRFCRTYFPIAFKLPWSQDHLRAIERIQTAVLTGGLFAFAMPRGSGKSTLCQRAAIWATLYGHHRYVLLIHADEAKAGRALETVKTELEQNPQLESDFPAVTKPIRALERIANRARGQTCDGEPTRIEWGKHRIVLPTVAGSDASAATIATGGILSAVRGAVQTLPTGDVVRPSLAIIDDPQTRASASSRLQCETREKIISGDLLGMAGPGEPFAALMPCTVIRKGDMADQMLDRKLHPDWQGERSKMLIKFPRHIDLWEKYREIQTDELRNDGDGKQATKFYRKHRKKMDAGAEVSWPERHRPDEISGLQHAMNLWLRDPEAFASEYQNEPLDEATADADLLTVDEIAQRVNRLTAGRVPLAAGTITAFIDVQAKLLWYVVVAFDPQFSGSIIDYGAYPRQKRTYYTLASARPTLAQRSPTAGREAAIYHGLEQLVGRLMTARWKREDGAELTIDLLLIDANWGESTDIVYQYCRDSVHAGRVVPSHGRFVGAASRPMSEYQRKPGEVVGSHWRMPSVASRKRAVRYALYDANFWKSFLHARLSTQYPEPGSLTLFRGTAKRHRMIAEHLAAEYRVRVTARERTVDEWKLRPERPDNHLLDCLAGACVAASMRGITLTALAPPEATKRKRKRREATYLDS